MAITRKMSAFVISAAITQMTGEMGGLGQTVKLSDIAAFLGCTKATASKYTKRAVSANRLKCTPVPYRKPTEKNPNGAWMHTYQLANHGEKMFNTPLYKSAKVSVLTARGVLS